VTRKLNRRRFLSIGASGAAFALLAACGAAPQASPAASPPAAAASTPAASGAQATPAAKASGTKKDVSLAIITRAGTFGAHTREFAKRYSTETGYPVEIQDVEWNDIPKKVETQLVSGDLADVLVCDQAFWPYLATKGTFLIIDDYVKSNPPPDFNDYPDLSWQKLWTGGKLAGLSGDAGINDIVTWYNKDVVAEVGGKEPTDDWTMDDYVTLMDLVVKKKPGMFGGASSMGGSHTGDGWIRNWGGWILDPTQSKVELTNPKTQEGIKWVTDMVARKLYPGRQDVTGQGNDTTSLFAAGKLFSITSNPGAYGGLETAVGTKFKLGTVLAPKGPSTKENPPRRAFIPYANRHGAYSKSKFPEEAYGLLVRVTGFESMKWLTMNTGKQPGNLKAWRDPEVLAKRPIYGKVADLMATCTDIFPVPKNTRYVEYRDRGDAELLKIEYGEAPFSASAMSDIQTKLQAIVDQPAPA
jgi:ABC-type glycerol-3-phosphate transport system substrate-binding protein